MINIVHLADLHIGVTTHGKIHYRSSTRVNDRVEDFLIAIDFVIDYVEENDIDLVVIPGDVYHSSTPTPAYISEFAVRLAEFAEICPVIIIPGNHDQAGNRVSALDMFGVVDIQNIYMWEEPTVEIISTKSGDIVVAGMPFPTHRVLGEGNLTTLSHAAMLKLVDHGFDETLPSILLGHFTIEGCVYGAYRGAVLKEDATVYIDAVDGLWDYVALGHIHIHQVVPSQHTPIVYSGSIERVNFGEAGEDKGFVHISIGAEVDYKFVAVPARPMVTVDIVMDDSMDSDDAIDIVRRARVHPDALARLRVTVNGNADYISIIEDANKALSDRVYRTINPQFERPVDESTRDDYVGNLSELDPTTMLEEYLVWRDIDDDEIDELLDLFEELNEDAI